jgi:hypothetical protein
MFLLTSDFSALAHQLTNDPSDPFCEVWVMPVPVALESGQCPAFAARPVGRGLSRPDLPENGEKFVYPM